MSFSKWNSTSTYVISLIDWFGRTLIPAPQAANYIHKGGVHTCPSIPKNAVTTVTLEDLPKSKNPTLTPLSHNTDSNAFTLTQVHMSFSVCPITLQIQDGPPHLLKHQTPHQWRTTHSKERLAVVFLFPAFSLPCVVLHLILPAFFIGITLVRRPSPLTTSTDAIIFHKAHANYQHTALTDVTNSPVAFTKRHSGSSYITSCYGCVVPSD